MTIFVIRTQKTWKAISSLEEGVEAGSARARVTWSSRELTIISGYGRRIWWDLNMETILNRRRKELRRRKYKSILSEIRKAVDFLYAEGANEVYLFGSVINPKQFTENSDIDFFVKGIDREKHLEIEGKLLDILKTVEYDILFFENEHEIRKEILERIKKEAVLWKPSSSI